MILFRKGEVVMMIEPPIAELLDKSEIDIRW